MNLVNQNYLLDVARGRECERDDHGGRATNAVAHINIVMGFIDYRMLLLCRHDTLSGLLNVCQCSSSTSRNNELFIYRSRGRQTKIVQAVIKNAYLNEMNDWVGLPKCMQIMFITI